MTNDKDSEVLIELREAIREAGVKRTTTRLYAAVMAFDAAWNTRQLAQSDALKAAAEAIHGLLDITSEYNLDSEQATRALAALRGIGAALREQSK